MTHLEKQIANECEISDLRAVIVELKAQIAARSEMIEKMELELRSQDDLNKKRQRLINELLRLC